MFWWYLGRYKIAYYHPLDYMLRNESRVQTLLKKEKKKNSEIFCIGEAVIRKGLDERHTRKLCCLDSP